MDFDFIRQGAHYNVHTAIGAGLADVQVTAHELVPVDADAPIDNSDETQPEPVFAVVDNRTGCVVGRYKNKKRARSRRDTLDLQYGAIRYSVREVAA